jgi:hypothetical protein
MRDTENRLTRRELMKLSLAAVLGGSATGWYEGLANRVCAAPQGKPRKACILLWMNGGPSQAHTFDLKDGGDFKPIATSVPGIQISEHLPKLAEQMQHLVLLRSMSTLTADHHLGQMHLHRGVNRALQNNQYPSMGNVASAALGQAEAVFPNFVAIEGGNHGGGVDPQGQISRTCYPGYLGAAHAPMIIDSPGKGIECITPVGDRAAFDDKVALFHKLEHRFHSQFGSETASGHLTAYQRAFRLLNSNLVKVLEIDREPSSVRDAYGRNQFGDACLLACRLVEAGVPFIEVVLRGCDDHGGGAGGFRKRSPVLDPAMAALITDLKQRGLLDNTLLVWMGEFGRSPMSGSNHFARAWTTVLGGGGLKTGQVVGRTDKTGGTVEERPISAADFVATIYQALDIDYRRSFQPTDGSRPQTFLDKKDNPNPVTEVFG